MTERLLSLVENPSIFCIVHLENSYKYKAGQSRLLIEEDNYQFDRYSSGLSRLLRIQAPVEKLQGFINELIVVKGLRTLIIP